MTQINHLNPILRNQMEENELNMDEFANSFKSKSDFMSQTNDIMVVGVGGGGGNAVNHMYKQGVDKVTFVVCNTDEVAVKASDVPNKVVIGNGRGAGNDPQKAKEFAERDIDKIEEIFNPDTRMAFITAGMGGGTGTGAGPVVARVAHERGILTIGIVTIPFLFEGKKKIMKALEGADEMAKYVDALLIINNERLTEIYPDLDFFNAFGKADDTLSTAARSISEIITTTGYINVDFEDVDRTLRDGGTAIISTGYGEGEHRVTKAIEDALNSPLLRNRDIFGSRSLLMNLYMSRDGDSSMAMTEVQELRNFVNDINPEVDIIWGVTVDNSLGDKVKITILAAGFDVTIREEEDEIIKGNATNKVQPHHRPGTKDKPGTNKTGIEKMLKGEYGDLSNLGSNFIVLTPEQMDNDAVIEILEQPASNRDKKVTESLRQGIVPQIAPPASDERTDKSASNKIIF